MKHSRKSTRRDTPAKVALVIALYSGAALISSSGVLFLVYSFTQNITLNILSMSIPGYVLALLMLFFGIRSFFAVHKFGQSVLKNSLSISLGLRHSQPVKSRSV